MPETDVPYTDPRLQELLAEGRWLRQLALRLAHDPHGAEDLTQSTWLKALSARLPAAANARAWLGTVMRNSWLDSQRREQRRQRREAVSASDSGEQMSVAASDELAAKAEIQKRVLEAVLRLKANYRTAILMRYFEDLSPAQIARRSNLPVATVKTRLNRGLEQLRQHLDDLHHGDRRAWLSAILPLAHSGRIWPLPVGILAMNTKPLLITAAVSLGLLVGWQFLIPGVDDAAAGEGTEEASAARLTEDEPGTMTQDSGKTERTALPVSPQAKEPEVASRMFRGIVLDAAAQPVSGVKVVLRTRTGVDVPPDAGTISGVGAVTDAQGAFRMEVPEGHRRIDVVPRDRITVLAGEIGPGSDPQSEPVTVIADAVTLDIHVTDENLGPVSGAKIRYSLPRRFRYRFPAAVLDHSADLYWHTTTDQQGVAQQWRIGFVPGATLVVRKLGFLPARFPVPKQDRRLDVKLERPTSKEAAILGQVTDPFGHKVPGARVALGQAETITDAEGRFILVVERSRRGRYLVAMKKGYQATQHQLREQEMPAKERPPTFLHLQLGPPPMQIGGVVVDGHDQPIAGAKVWIKDVTAFGDRAVVVEAVQAVNNDKKRWYYHVVTNSRGEFLITGLLNRPYTLTAALSAFQLQADGGPFPAGTPHARIVLPTHTLLPKVAGTVVTGDGTPLAGVSVQASTTTMRLQRRTGGVTSWGDRDGPKTITDAAGRFQLGKLGWRRVSLAFRSDEIMPKFVPLEQAGKPRDGIDNLRIVVSRRIHFRVQLTNKGMADSFDLLDGAGKRLMISEIKGQTRNTTWRVLLHDGKSDVRSVDDTARTVVLYRDGKEVLRAPVRLFPDKINLVEL